MGVVTNGKNILEEGKEYSAPSYEVRLGGSVVNFAQQAKTLGASVGLMGKRGSDEPGQQLERLLARAGISSEGIAVADDVQTCVDSGIVFEHNGQNIQIVAGDANSKFSFDDINLESSLFHEAHAIYLGGFLKQKSLYREYPRLLNHCCEKQLKIFLDHGRIPVDCDAEKLQILRQALAYVDVYMPNEVELFGLTGEHVVEQALEIALSFGPKVVVVKRGELGCIVKTKDEQFDMPGFKITPITTVGAGDCFNAGFVTSYLEGKSLLECAKVGNATAAIKVSQNIHPGNLEVQNFFEPHS